ncbi:transmembrane adaptor Erv26-domain-containing protein [Pilobolus umbonatus]|nr:transmembrane adaptor Erv26-domain-containing protein [Pilobolus umbonatus]
MQLGFSILCHLVYSLNLKTFPFINLTGLPFISSCILVFVDHFLWFRYFTTYHIPFMDIAAFFGLCVWLIPLAYFISLSANDNALPVSNGDPTFQDSYPSAQNKQGIFKNLLSSIGIKTQDTIPLTATDYTSNYMSPPSVPVNESYIPPTRRYHSKKAA